MKQFGREKSPGLDGLAKVLVNHLQAVIYSVFGFEETCAVKNRTVQDNLHIVRLSIEQVNSENTLINVDLSKGIRNGGTSIFGGYPFGPGFD